ncbi:hypothetical protein HOLleu_29600 [Holothuria leucospilota]|uniref:Uncharacterized protein n=1 Tax=Holothuria leucospilota TaxID=206669 RepID=A0A9Q1H2R3_HOLLE|nr:hypothetical protein HOLleu_29600 [Holothuria leucospilota]
MANFIMKAVKEATEVGNVPTSPAPKRARLEDIDDDISSIFNAFHTANEIEASPNILDTVLNELDDEDTGPPIEQKVADMVTKVQTNKMSEEKFKEKCKKYSRPSNCDMLQQTKVNQLIWEKLRPATSRSRDIKFQKCQTATKGIIALTETVKLLLSCPNVEKSIIHGIFDAITLVAQGNLELNLARRELLKPDLSQDFQQLCSQNVPVTTQLFGDDIEKRVKDIAASTKIGAKVSYRGNYHSRGYRGRGRPFLARGKSWAFRPPVAGRVSKKN